MIENLVDNKLNASYELYGIGNIDGNTEDLISDKTVKKFIQA